jgi:hypothetical protein
MNSTIDGVVPVEAPSTKLSDLRGMLRPDQVMPAGCEVHSLAHPCEACAAELPYRELLEHWTHESHLQTFEDRERFRKAARALLDGDGVQEVPRG